jgi:hypothetical protein
MTRSEGLVKTGRRRYLDFILMFVVVGLVFFHSARVFDSGDFYVKNRPPSEVSDFFIGFASTWGMPLLFVISGMGIWYSLRSRATGAFATERVRRLLVPLVFGVLVIVPPQVWTDLRANSAYGGSYRDLMSRFLDLKFQLGHFPFVVGASEPLGVFQTAHLWFLVLLFAWSLLLLPLIWYLRQPSGLRLLDRLAAKIDRFSLMALAALPFVFFDVVFKGEVVLAGSNRLSYAVFILYGYVLASDRRFGHAIRTHRKRALLAGIVTFGIVGAAVLGSGRAGSELLEGSDAASLLMRAARAFSGWFWVVAIMGFAARLAKPRAAHSDATSKSSFMKRVGAYLSEAVLPVYVLHQTVIVLLAFYIVEWQVNALVKYLALSTGSLVVIMVIYDLVIRRTAVTRFLFGMKPSRHPANSAMLPNHGNEPAETSSSTIN